MPADPDPIQEIRPLLSAFNEGYSKRDPSALDRFMDLFAADENIEFIATGGAGPGRGTWRTGRAAVRDLIRSDWEYWGVVHVEAETAHIEVRSEVAWVSATGTVRTDDETEEFLGDKEEIFGVVQHASGSSPRVKPLRMTAVLLKQAGRWRFFQIHHSFSIRSLPK